MKNRRNYSITAVFVLAAIGLTWFGITQWQRAAVKRQDTKARAQIAEYLSKGRAQEAAALLRLQPRPFRSPPWADLELLVLTEARDVFALENLYKRDPAALMRSEDASLILARAWLANKNKARYDALRQAWSGREKNPARWTLLDADELLYQGKRDAAAKLLKGNIYSGSDEAGRLFRLALIVAARDPKAAWAYLLQANTADPRNPEVHSSMAQFFERAARISDARVEYIAAIMSDSANPLLWDQLAEFYRRQGDLDLALRAWQSSLQPGAPEFLWVKALFWARVVQPLTTPIPDPTLKGGLAPLIAQMRATPADLFFTTAAMYGTEKSKARQQNRPEAAFLTVLEHLRAGREFEALQTIEGQAALMKYLQPDLTVALRQILAFRRSGAMPTGPGLDAGSSRNGARHSFFDELAGRRKNAASISVAASDEFLKSPHAFAAACLAAGWREGALILWGNRPLTAEIPEWYVYALAQAIRYNRKPASALALLATRPSTPLLEGLAGELLIIQGRQDEGCKRLEPLTSRPDAIGYRAAWLVAVTRMEQGRIDAVRPIMERQPALARSVTGREIEARLELAAGHTDKAAAIYRDLAPNSVEGRVWLARRAAADGDWEQAHRLTLELLGLMPDEMALRRSLAAIEARIQEKSRGGKNER